MNRLVTMTLVFYFICNTAFAQNTSVSAFRFFPEVKMIFKQDNNILQQSHNEMDSFITIFDPKIRLERQQRRFSYGVTLGSEIGRYANSPADNYEDFLLSAQSEWQLTRRASVQVRSEYLKEHDDRGTTERVDIGIPYRWHSQKFEGQFNYGRPNARGRIETVIGHVTKSYDNYTLENQEQTNITTRFYYRTTPKIRLLAEAERILTDYSALIATQDSETSNYSIGATWYATAKTTGSVRLGYLIKDFKAAERQDFSGLSWNVAIRWVPQSRSSIDISTGQYIDESTGHVGDYVLTRDFWVAWTYFWKSRLSTTIGLYAANKKFGGHTGSQLRSDRINRLELAVNYNWRKWLTLTVGLNLTERDSNVDDRDFDRIFWLASLTASF